MSQKSLPFLPRFVIFTCPVLDRNAGSDDGDSSEQISENFSAKILLFLRGFVILPCRASTYVTEEKGGYDAFVGHFFMAKSEEWR